MLGCGACTVMGDVPNAGSALGMNPVTGRVGRHYAWPSSGPSAAMIGALVQVAGMVSDTNREPSPPSGNRRSGVLGGQSQFAARPLGWSDLNRLLEPPL
jgi:hypothetical protein